MALPQRSQPTGRRARLQAGGLAQGSSSSSSSSPSSSSSSSLSSSSSSGMSEKTSSGISEKTSRARVANWLQKLLAAGERAAAASAQPSATSYRWVIGCGLLAAFTTVIALSNLALNRLTLRLGARDVVVAAVTALLWKRHDVVFVGTVATVALDNPQLPPLLPRGRYGEMAVAAHG